MISIGFLLMAFRRLYELVEIIDKGTEFTPALINWMAVLISLMMFIGAFYIRRIFELQERIDKMRKENDAKVLSAIIKTEEHERKNFSKELHDGLGPILSSIKMGITAIDRTKANASNKRIIDRTEKAIDSAIISIKEVSNNISPHILERYGLEKAIRTFSDTLVTSKGVHFIITSNLNSSRYNYNIEVILYRILCELITNTLKYASASNVTISLIKHDKMLDMCYADDGSGFDFQRNETKGMGLFNIGSRVKSLDGTMEIHTKPGKGFFIKIIIPL